MVGILLAGCANSSNSVANSNASANTNTVSAAPAPSAPAKQPQRFGSYGVSTTGYNTTLASQVNSMITGEDTDEPETKVAAVTPSGPAPAGGTSASGAKSAAPPAGAATSQQAQAQGQPQLAQSQPQDPPKSKAQQAEENVPGLYGAPRAPQKDVVHWLLETTKDDQQ